MNTDRAREATLRAYHDLMTGLVLDEQPQNSEPDSPVRAVAHAQTFAALRDLDGPRKGTIVQFLHDPKLILKGQPVVSLSLADLSDADLSSANLKEAGLSGANLTSADFYYTDLSEVDLSDVNLGNANLYEAVLSDADLSRTNLQDAIMYKADLRGAKLQGAVATDDQLREACSLVDATMPDGSEMTGELWQQFQKEFS